ncbi:MAG: hypothetical protein PHI00_06225 [Atribacterota bacterium]|nr:hypothetical protein [Atribacterota bacterium]HPZ40027.1 hypothetical protein [Candidatus Atribacteria bacterium]HQD33528.1 hypothetical protein [Candidatus Atribacteria bacterium]
MAVKWVTMGLVINYNLRCNNKKEMIKSESTTPEKASWSTCVR